MTVQDNLRRLVRDAQRARRAREKTNKDRQVEGRLDNVSQVNRTAKLTKRQETEKPAEDNDIYGNVLESWKDGKKPNLDDAVKMSKGEQPENPAEETSFNSNLVGQQMKSAVSNKREFDKSNQLNETVSLDTQNVPEKDIYDQVDDRFTRMPMGNDSWFDRDSGQVVSNEDKSSIEKKMLEDYSSRIQAEEDAKTPSTMSTVIEGVAGAAPTIQFPESMEGRDFSDEANAWLAENIDASVIPDIGSAVYDMSREDWKRFVQDDNMRDFYQDLYTNGAFDENVFEDWFDYNKSLTYEDVYEAMDENGTNDSDRHLSGDYDAFRSITKHALENDGLAYELINGDNPDESYVSYNMDDIIDNMAYEYLVNAATNAIEQGYDGNFKDMFGNDVNRFAVLDGWEVGPVEDGYMAPSDLGKFESPNPNILVRQNPYISEDQSVFLPVSGGLDNVISAMGEGYGAKEKKKD